MDEALIGETDPLVALSRHYAMTSASIVRLLRPIVTGRGDLTLLEALDTIEWFSSSVAGTIYRAVRRSCDPDFDATDLHGDANGSAKAALLSIEQSRRGWRVLMEPGRAIGDGVPARLVQMLDDLAVGVTERFARAMDSLRPGFDDPHEALLQ
jgi:hypothetical protein